jgi:hypothetical protein
MPAAYRIIDEPAPAALERTIVNPTWPLFASMFAGSWLAFPWFVLNAFALGGRRRFADLGLALAGWLTSGLILVGILQLLSDMTLTERGLPYALLAPVGVRLVVVYWLFLRQLQTFEIYTHFGGATRSGLFVVIAGGLLRGSVMGALPDFWQAVLS